MSLNIKNEETHRLVRQLAELTGQSQTSAVEDAVRRRLADIVRQNSREERLRRLTEIAEDVSRHLDPSVSLDPNDFLYDEYGLPR